MSDVNAHIILPLKKFAKESAHLVKKCTKPDRKGERCLTSIRAQTSLSHGAAGLTSNLYSARIVCAGFRNTFFHLHPRGRSEDFGKSLPPHAAAPLTTISAPDLGSMCHFW
jgi:hypothetical protein